MSPDFFPQRPATHPMIYAYEDTNPQYRGLLKVGYTTVDVDRRVAQQLSLIHILWNFSCVSTAVAPQSD